MSRALGFELFLCFWFRGFCGVIVLCVTCCRMVILTSNCRGCQPSRKGSLMKSTQQLNLFRPGLRILKHELHRLNRIDILRTSFSFHDII